MTWWIAIFGCLFLTLPYILGYLSPFILQNPIQSLLQYRLPSAKFTLHFNGSFFGFQNIYVELTYTDPNTNRLVSFTFTLDYIGLVFDFTNPPYFLLQFHILHPVLAGDVNTDSLFYLLFSPSPTPESVDTVHHVGTGNSRQVLQN